MPGSLFNIGRYINKKKKPDESGDASVVQTETTMSVSNTESPSPSASVSATTTQTPSSTPQTTKQTTTTVTKTTNQPANALPQSPDNPEDAMAKPPPPPPPLSGQESPPQPDGIPVQPTGQSAASVQKRAGMDILSRLTQRSNNALVAGVNKAKEYKVPFVDTEHILWGLLQDSGIYQLISEFKIAPIEIVKAVEKTFKTGKAAEAPKFSPRVKKVLELSFTDARTGGYEFISPDHILVGLVEEKEGVAAQILSKFGVTDDKLRKKVGMKRDKEKEAKSAVSEFATDLTQLAREWKLDPVVARSKEVERVMHILSRRTKNNPVLIGDAGVGKTAIVEGLAQRIVSGNVPETLTNRHILSLDLTSLLAGASHRGEFESRFKQLLSEVKASQGQMILFIDEIHNMVGAGSSGGTMDASNILKPSLARGEVQTIGATTVEEYRKYIEKDRALERRFQPILIEEPSVDQAIMMLRALKDKYEAFHKVSISDESIRSAAHLSARYIGDRSLPDKAIDLIDEAASSTKLPAISLPEEIQTLEEKSKRLTAERDEARAENNAVREGTIDREITKLEKELVQKRQEHELKKGQTTSVITPEIIHEIISKWTGIPISRLTQTESEKLAKMENVLSEKLIGQDQAVGAVSEAVRRGRAGLASSRRPIGSFIFMGPTGVGKTELAKVLADELFGSQDMMTRIDMTEYMEKHEVAKLIGAPPGYVGYEEGGQLTEAVRRHPYSVVLLDEIEKAHPDVFNILLQILDDGRLTDNKGRTISFKNTILICTSNLGTGHINNALLKGMKVGSISEVTTEPIGTYVVTPTGREIVTRGKDFWERNLKGDEKDGKRNWTKKPLEQYFSGQVVIGQENLNLGQQFPLDGMDTHTILPSGEEIVTQKDILLRRKSTIAKQWDKVTLLDYFKNHTVENAEPDKPDQQLPTGAWDTHAISPTEQEVIGVGSRLWIRENLTSTTWRTTTRVDYVREGIEIEDATSEQQISAGSEPGAEMPSTEETDGENHDTMNAATAADQTAPTAGQGEMPAGESTEATVPPANETPATGQQEQPTAAEIPPQPEPAAAAGQTAPEETAKPASETTDASSDQKTESEEGQKEATEGEEKEKKEEPASPNAAEPWDAHFFTPTGNEVIIQKDTYWAHMSGKPWKKGELETLVMGENAPYGNKAQIKKDEEAYEAQFAPLAEKLLEELRTFFRPELLNRFDEIIVFRPLQAHHMLRILDLQLKDLEKNMEEQEFGVEVTQAAKEQVILEGFDPVYGARPLRRTIQRLIENPVSTMLIQGKMKRGDIVVVDYDAKAEDFTFVTKRTPTKKPEEQQSADGKEASKEAGKEDQKKAEGAEEGKKPDEEKQKTEQTEGTAEPLVIDAGTLAEAEELSAAMGSGNTGAASSQDKGVMAQTSAQQPGSGMPLSAGAEAGIQPDHSTPPGMPQQPAGSVQPDLPTLNASQVTQMTGEANQSGLPGEPTQPGQPTDYGAQPPTNGFSATPPPPASNQQPGQLPPLEPVTFPSNPQPPQQ
ncbi:MAG TPA: AAA family ATPase [Patescibacteria group bacterium]|nr:AAA family ATPase [Patescibacteria group bacterium]